MQADETKGRAPARVRVETDGVPDTGYDVVIQPALLERAASLLPQIVPAHRYAIITDDHVGPLHADRFRAKLADQGADPELLSIRPGESNKTRQTWAELTDRLLEGEHARDSCIIAAGGGVVGDIAGFVAATYMRGIPWVNVPTTLLAMLDASVGGKTGVDTPAGKNLVGAYHQPAVVLIDPEVLRTLPESAVRAGMAEAIKHGVIEDAEYFEWIGKRGPEILSLDGATVSHLVRRSVEIKAGVVSEDVHEGGRRAILNFGHTLGHAVEMVTGFGVSHGEAVAVGMVGEALIGERLGVTEQGTAARIAAAVERFGLPVHLGGMSATPAQLLAATRADKKVRASMVRYALPAGVGAFHRGGAGEWTIPVPDSVVLEVAEALRSAISQA